MAEEQGGQVIVGGEVVDPNNFGGVDPGGGGGGGDPIDAAMAMSQAMEAQKNQFAAAQAQAQREFLAREAALDREFQREQNELARALSKEQFQKTYAENKRQFDLARQQRSEEFQRSQNQQWATFSAQYSLQAEQLKTAREQVFANPRNLVQRFGASNAADPQIQQAISRDFQRRASAGLITPAEIASGEAFRHGVSPNYKQPSYELPQMFGGGQGQANIPSQTQPTTETGGTPPSTEQALDIIAERRPDILNHDRANGWTINGPEDVRRAILDWLGNTPEGPVESAGRDPVRFVVSSGWWQPPAQGAAAGAANGAPQIQPQPNGQPMIADGAPVVSNRTTGPVAAMTDPSQARVQPITPAGIGGGMNILSPMPQPTPVRSQFADPVQPAIPGGPRVMQPRFIPVPDLGSSPVADRIEQFANIPYITPAGIDIMAGGPLQWEYGEVRGG